MTFKQQLSALLLSTLPLLVNATPPQWDIVPKESELTFTATQNGAPVTGKFEQFTGTIFADANDLSHSKIDISIDINSLSVSLADLKSTLMTSDWFSTALFPKAEFKANQFTKVADKTYHATGILTIRNKPVPVVLTFTLDETNLPKALVVGSAVIKRSAFGVGQGEWAGVSEIKDDVTVNFKVVAVKK